VNTRPLDAAARTHLADRHGPPDNSSGLPDTHTVAVMLNCSVQTVERERRRGRLPYVVVGANLIRFLPADIDSYLQRNRKVASPEAVA
jgi:excisionase family DNA binding protein